MIVLLGALGSMGRRYQAILRYLDVACRPLDAEAPYLLPQVLALVEQASGVIIASPTATHEFWLQRLAARGVPILCEKPVTTRVAALGPLLDAIKGPFRMMQQYAELDPAGDGESLYDFYHTGSDGLRWDCMQVIGLARGACTIRNESPIWRCRLNGLALTLDEMGEAYVRHVGRWLREPEGDRAQIVRMHEKAAAWSG